MGVRIDARVDADGGVRFGVLGPLQVVDGGGAAKVVSAAKQRVVLASLLLAGGSTVSAARLAEALWDACPPPNAPAVMRTYMTRLRQALGTAAVRIVGRPSGWAVELRGPEEFDLAEVDGLWHAAGAAGEAGEWRRVSSLLARALSLWRGEALVDVPSDALGRRESGRLAELRLQVTDARIDADLRLGRHGELVAGLRRLAAEHPLREHIQVQLMLACYRSGHQGAALEVYRDARATLAEELGVEPGPELHEMHQKILAADPGLMATAPARLTIGHSDDDHPRQPMPRQLPSAVGHFTGRAAELRRLTELAEEARAMGTAATTVIGGMPGVGKTALAVHWAHQAADRFPDGQLYVNLRGFDPSGQPMPPEEAVRDFLDALEVAAERIPANLNARAGLYRSMLSGKRMLVLLDNARDAGQVRPLLPGSPGCLTLVTSRSHLTGLLAAQDAYLVNLDGLTQAEAYELLARRLGVAQIAAEPAAIRELAGLCAGLPLALSIVAAQAAEHPGWPLAAVAARLRDSRRRLDTLDPGDAATALRSVFSWSYRQLSEPAAGMFRLLGIHPGPDISLAAAASMARSAVKQTRDALGELADAGLVWEQNSGRFTFHDLLRAYATEQALLTDDEEARRAATGRVLDHYLHTGYAAALLLNPSREPITLALARPGVTPERLVGHQQALSWFDAERRVLLSVVTLAVDTGFDACAWQLPWTMTDFLDWRGHWPEWSDVQRKALAAATRLGDTAGQAAARHLLAQACARVGDYDQARAHLTECLGLCRQIGDRAGEARVHQTLCWMAQRQGRHADWLSHAEQALALFRAIADPAGQADALNNLGWHYAQLGDPQQARTFCQQALTLQHELGNRHGEANTWDSLGYAEHQLGHLAEAAACYQRALDISRELGNRYFETEVLTHLGNTHRAARHATAAGDAWQQALDILDELRHPDAGQVRSKLRFVIGGDCGAKAVSVPGLFGDLQNPVKIPWATRRASPVPSAAGA